MYIENDFTVGLPQVKSGWELPNLKWGSESPQPMTRHNSIAFQNRISDCRAHETHHFLIIINIFFHLLLINYN